MPVLLTSATCHRGSGRHRRPCRCENSRPRKNAGRPVATGNSVDADHARCRSYQTLFLLAIIFENPYSCARMSAPEKGSGGYQRILIHFKGWYRRMDMEASSGQTVMIIWSQPIMKALAPGFSIVAPAKAGAQNVLKRLDSGLRRNDEGANPVAGPSGKRLRIIVRQDGVIRAIGSVT